VKPRNGHTLVVGIVARISGCAKQKEVSLEDQVDHGKEVVAEDLLNQVQRLQHQVSPIDIDGGARNIG
jgi:hypothetical protein